MAPPVLTRRQLNRALLARQLLLERSALPVPAALEHLVGMQAQSPQAPYVGLWSRLEGFRADDLARLLVGRQTVRLTLMRWTVHLVTARDCLRLRPVVAPVIARRLQSSFGRQLEGIDLAELAAAGRALVDQEPRTWNELGKLLSERWPDRDPLALANAVGAHVPLVQVPPRGLWHKSGSAKHTSAEAWLGQPLDDRASAEDVVLRYLAAFGPASVADFRVWSGLSGARELVDGLRPQLRTFRDPDGRELFDVPDGPLPPEDAPAPARFLPEFDNLLLSHADRTRVIADADRPKVFTRGAFLVDGFAAGTWSPKLELHPFASLPKRHRAAIEAEAERLRRFLA